MDTSQLVGSVVNLITNAQVRYEGTLKGIDRVSRTMHLTNVISFGSENRKVPDMIPRSDNVRSDVVFKVELIKDFEIIKRPQAEVKSEDMFKKDPAVVIPDQTEDKIEGVKTFKPLKKLNASSGKKNIIGKKFGENPNESLIT